MVVMEDTSVNTSDGAYYSQGEIHLDCRYGAWHGLPGAAQHEFGHWLDDMTRGGNGNVSAKTAMDLEKAYTDAKIADLKELCKKADSIPDMGAKPMTIEEKRVRMFGNDNDNRTGTFWDEVSIALFGHPCQLKPLEEQYVIVSYADTLQSMTIGKYGWGHENRYAGKDNHSKEALAEAFYAYVRKDRHYEKTFPHLWNYIKKVVGHYEP
jgi:hypothetical protein